MKKLSLVWTGVLSPSSAFPVLKIFTHTASSSVLGDWNQCNDQLLPDVLDRENQHCTVRKTSHTLWCIEKFSFFLVQKHHIQCHALRSSASCCYTKTLHTVLHRVAQLHAVTNTSCVEMLSLVLLLTQYIHCVALGGSAQCCAIPYIRRS